MKTYDLVAQFNRPLSSWAEPGDAEITIQVSGDELNFIFLLKIDRFDNFTYSNLNSDEVYWMSVDQFGELEELPFAVKQQLGPVFFKKLNEIRNSNTALAFDSELEIQTEFCPFFEIKIEY